MRPCLMLILDGFGDRKEAFGNAISLAKTKGLDEIKRTYPSTLLDASGLAVGLPALQMGNSEVGHMTLGAGRVLLQDLPRISAAIEDGSFSENQELLRLITAVKERSAALHIMGLASKGGVHSHIDHALEIVRCCRRMGLDRVFIHAFLDGRDTPPSSAGSEMESFAAQLKSIGVGQVASLVGRFYAMDRDERWDRVAKAYHLLVDGIGRACDVEAGLSAAVDSAYALLQSDEFVEPIVMTHKGQPVSKIQTGDGVIFFNFRADRARELTDAFTDPQFSSFPIADAPALSGFLTMTKYDSWSKIPSMFSPSVVKNHLGEYLSSLGLFQLRIAETEKYDHVTFFFHGGREEKYPLEERWMVPSRRDVKTYDDAPAMNAEGITEKVLEAIESERYALTVVNFANPDMVGHTGNLPAAIEAIEVIDGCISRIVKAAKAKGVCVILTADHGNCETMIDPETQKKHTAHTTNPVPFFLIDDLYLGAKLREHGGLKDVAPTILALMGLEKPEEMTGESLLL